MTTADPIALAWVGPDEHGITRFARQIASAVVDLGFTGGTVTASDGLGTLAARVPDGVVLVHLQINDWLLGGLGADRQVPEFAAALRHRGIGLTVTLHDLPHTAVSPELYRRRAETYAAICAEAVGVIVSSEHERDLLLTAVAAARPGTVPPAVTVIPLPVPAGRVPEMSAPTLSVPARATVGVFGFLYPGKGHREVIAALAGFDEEVELLAIGRPSDGHDGLLTELADQAAQSGISFRATGFLPDDEVSVALQTVTVPVAPAPQVSASGSINSWLGAGRRPLVLAGGYTRELARRNPGSVRLYDGPDLAAKIREALADPALTKLAPGVRPEPSLASVAALYLAWLRARVT